MKKFTPDSTEFPTDPRFKDLTGKNFTRLEVKSYAGKSGNVHYWLCACTCSAHIAVRANHLASGSTQSCGCLQKEATSTANTRHGMVNTPTYSSWDNMKDRCYNPNNSRFDRYGARGVRVCKRWRTFENFYKDMGEKPSLKHSVEREDNNGDYEPSNCRWATAHEQAQNRNTNKLNPELVRSIRAMYATGVSCLEIRRRLSIDVATRTVWSAATRRTWPNID